MRTLYKLALIGAAVLMLPVLASPAGIYVGVFLAVAWIVLIVGGREAWELKKKREYGMRTEGSATDMDAGQHGGSGGSGGVRGRIKRGGRK